MTYRPDLPPGPYLVVGLARSGRAAAALLRARGHEVLATDRAAPEALAAELPGGVELHAGVDGVALLERVRTVVKSPGVPQEAPVIVAARERGMPVLGELELAWRCSAAAWSVRAWASCGSTRSRRRSSWATRARSGSAARSPGSP